MGVVHGVRTFAPLFIAQGSGHFLNTASAGGLMPLPTLAPYNATMHAVVGLTETLNAEFKSVSDESGRHRIVPGNGGHPARRELRRVGTAEALPPIAAEGAGRWRCWARSVPCIVAEAAIAAVEAGRVHAVVGPGAAEWPDSESTRY